MSCLRALRSVCLTAITDQSTVSFLFYFNHFCVSIPVLAVVGQGTMIDRAPCPYLVIRAAVKHMMP